MIGQLNISMVVCSGRFVVDNGAHQTHSSYTKKVRLATYYCDREECDRKLSEFAEANPSLWGAMRKDIFAEWVGRERVRCP